MVSVRDEIRSVVAKCEFNNILKGWSLGEEGFYVRWQIVPCPVCRCVEEVALLLTQHKAGRDRHLGRSWCEASRLIRFLGTEDKGVGRVDKKG